MKLTALELNEILKETSRHKYLNSFDRANFDECVVWANKVADLTDPKSCFRKLKIDHNFADDFRSEYHSQILLNRARSEDSECESSLLYGPPIYPNLKGGRMLVMRPNDSLCDGIANEVTRGFFDLNNLPPPMLTTELVDSPEFRFSASDAQNYLVQDNYILSYIPEPFVFMVQQAIDANAEECILWLEDEKHFTAQIFKSHGLWTV